MVSTVLPCFAEIKYNAMKHARIFIVAVLAGLSLASSAQTWTLDSCINYAVDNNINVRMRALQVNSSRLDVDDARNRFLPTLQGYASQSFNFGRGLTQDNTYANRNTSSFAAGANVSLPLFQGLSAVRRLGYAKANLAAMLEQAEAAKEDVTLNVITGYLQALYTSELAAVARERAAISRRELERTESLVEAGRLPELDLYQARAQLSQDELAVVNAANDSTVALLDLSQILNLPVDADLRISPLDDSLPPLMTADEVFRAALARNHTLRAAELEAEAADRSIAVAQSGYLPTLSFNAGIGTNYYHTGGVNNESFGGQMRHNFSQSIGFSLSVPVFDAFVTRNNVRRARIESENARLRMDDTRMQLYKAITQAYTQAVGAVRQRQATADALTSARAAYDAMNVKYENGRANATELEKAKSDYTNAMAESVRSKYEFILRARILEFYAR